MATLTPFVGHTAALLGPRGSHRFRDEPPSDEMLWAELELLADSRERGRALFPGRPLRNKNRLWTEFRNYIRQARTYYMSARQVPGSSAGLLYYYAMLNAASAELLVRKPEISGDPVLNRHGLSYSTRGKTLWGDRMTVFEGVFQQLYEVRTGHHLPAKSTLPVRRLLANCPEIDWHSRQVRGAAAPEVTPLVHAVVHAGRQAWSLLCLDPPPDMRTTRVSRQGRSLTTRSTSATARLLLDHFDPLGRAFPDKSSVFAAASRFDVVGHHVFESKAKLDVEMRWDRTIEKVSADTWEKLTLILDHSWDEQWDALLCPSLYRSRMVPMPASMARYALMFYVSSLVRYNPSQLDVRTSPEEAWLIDAFTARSALPLLASAVTGITGRPPRFASPASLRG